MTSYRNLKLVRLCDDQTYKFECHERTKDVIAYKRQDQDLWVTYQGRKGWVVFDEYNKTIVCRPWEVLPDEQSSEHPPEGIWISRRGPKSDVFELKYCQPD